jgi:hypothetical protein
VAGKPAWVVIATLAMTATAIAEGARYEIFPSPDVRKTSTNWVNSAYAVDKKDNQFWICTARYDFSSNGADQGECVKLPSDIGRPSVTEKYAVSAVTGTVPYGAFLPVLWFVEPATGDVQFCALRATGICVRMSLR